MTTTATTTKDEDDGEGRKHRKTTAGSDGAKFQKKAGQSSGDGGKLLNTKTAIFEPVSCGLETKKKGLIQIVGVRTYLREITKRRREKKTRRDEIWGYLLKSSGGGWGRRASRLSLSASFESGNRKLEGASFLLDAGLARVVCTYLP